MERAGLAVAQFAMAVAPHAQVIWIPCGPGNNGGDGYKAAKHLKLWGKTPVVTRLQSSKALPADAAIAYQEAVTAGVAFADTAPEHYDLCIDALFGIGQVRHFDALCSAWIQQINSRVAPVVAVDVPSGLDSDTGTASPHCVMANYTLSLLTLKPGLFMADGRDACGDIWFNSLEASAPAHACAQLNHPPGRGDRAHNTHKGSYGDVCIVGGSSGMIGAALLAARAALHGGSGRVYVGLLAPATTQLDRNQPELMFRDPLTLAIDAIAVVAGCGGGDAIHAHLPRILVQAKHLVLDADALNAVAQDAKLQDLLAARAANTTVLTPHPLEAARLMNMGSKDIQSNRLHLAQAMAERFACTVALKGSGSIITAPGQLARINTTGNARLATAGTGDVLAGMIGARLAAGSDAFVSACESVFRHGQVADMWNATATMTAQDLIQAI
jgi:hydroxyethylthiazole kinase-like uncharacterized protein yjeF